MTATVQYNSNNSCDSEVSFGLVKIIPDIHQIGKYATLIINSLQHTEPFTEFLEIKGKIPPCR
jgi:hypothetical protein